MTGTNASSLATSALLSFRARNVRSYWGEANLSLLGTKLSEEGVARNLACAGSRSLSVLPAAGIFGANASGKSTILRAMADMSSTVLNSFREGNQESKLPRQPFLLNSEGAEHPSSFAVDLILDGVRWQYGFEINDHRVSPSTHTTIRKGSKDSSSAATGMPPTRSSDQRFAPPAAR